MGATGSDGHRDQHFEEFVTSLHTSYPPRSDVVVVW